MEEIDEFGPCPSDVGVPSLQGDAVRGRLWLLFLGKRCSREGRGAQSQRLLNADRLIAHCMYHVASSHCDVSKARRPCAPLGIPQCLYIIVK